MERGMVQSRYRKRRESATIAEFTTNAMELEITRHGLVIFMPYAIHQNCPKMKMPYMIRLMSLEDFLVQIR